jgi:hypothetical protein
MIRFVVALFIFAVALCAYIINTQHGGILPQSAPDATPEIIAEIPAPEPDAEPDVVPLTDDVADQILDAIVTRELEFETASIPVSAAVRDTLAVLGLDLATDAAPPSDHRFATQIGEALKAGTPDTDIKEAITAVAQLGGLAVPAGLVTADQKIDLDTYLKAVVTIAVLATEGTDPVVPDLSNDPDAIISVDGYDYVIKPSDSLASIAVKFYGDIAQTSRLIQANPIALAQPDQLIAGTTISIPAF